MAQENSDHHAISGEIGGLGAIGISGQYDYMFCRSIHGFYNVRIGLGGWYYKNDAGISFPHAITYNFGHPCHYFEVGIGGTFVNEYYLADQRSSAKYFIGPVIGYRSIAAKGFQFRVYINPMFYANGNYSGFAYPMAGIGFGKAFRKK